MFVTLTPYLKMYTDYVIKLESNIHYIADKMQRSVKLADEIKAIIGEVFMHATYDFFQTYNSILALLLN